MTEIIGPQRVGMGLKFVPVVVRHLLGSLSVFGPIWLALLGFIASSNSLNGGFNLPPAVQPSPPSTPSHSPTLPPLICATCDFTVVVKKVAQNPALLAS